MRGGEGSLAVCSVMLIWRAGCCGRALRAIRRPVDAALVRLDGDFASIYSPIGRPSIPPEQLLRVLA